MPRSSGSSPLFFGAGRFFGFGSGAVCSAMMPRSSGGISGGGGLTAVVLMLLLPHHIDLLVPAAFTGALATALIVYGVGFLFMTLVFAAMALYVGRFLDELVPMYTLVLKASG